MPEVNNSTPTNSTDPVNQTPTDDKGTSVEQMAAEIAALRAERDKLKASNDKASSEAANYKKQLRSKQTAEEQEAEAKAEADRIKDERLQNAEKELNHLKAVNAYKGIDEKSVEKLIDAVADGDHAAIAALIDKEVKAKVAEAQAEWMKSRPRVNAGGAYSQMTKEQIMSIADRTERRKAIAQNIELFN